MKKIIILLPVIFLLVACSTKKYYTSRGELKNITDARLIKNVQENYIDYSTIFYKKFQADINIEGDHKSFKGNLFINGDKEIIVSILPLMGIELARVRFSEDSIEILNRSNRSYQLHDYDHLWDKFSLDINFETLQDILLNELYIYPVSNSYIEEIKKYKHYLKDSVYVFKSVKKGRLKRIKKGKGKDDIVLHDLTVLPEVFKISNSYIKDFDSNSELSITYGDFISINDELIANKITLKGKRGIEDFSITIKFDVIEIDGKNKIGFKVSNKYNIIKK